MDSELENEELPHGEHHPLVIEVTMQAEAFSYIVEKPEGIWVFNQDRSVSCVGKASVLEGEQ